MVDDYYLRPGDTFHQLSSTADLLAHMLSLQTWVTQVIRRGRLCQRVGRGRLERQGLAFAH
jgi:hypothetical protein